MREPRCAISLILSHTLQIGAITVYIVIYNLNKPNIADMAYFAAYRPTTSRKRFS